MSEQHITDIERITIAGRMLAEAVTLPDIKQVISLAEAGIRYAKAANLGTEAQNTAAEIAIRGKRKAGEVLAQLEREQGKRNDTLSNVGQSSEYAKVLEESGTSRQDANRWQTIAIMPEDKFEDHIKQRRDGGQELTTAAIYRDAIQATAADKPPAPELPTDKYRIIYADPPWKYETFGVSVSEFYGGSERHYPVMTIEELEELPIKNMVEDDAVLFLWVTSPKLNQVWGIIKAWGFEYKTSFVWDKVKHNFGYYNSVRHELLLVCGRGSSTPDVAKLYDSVQSIDRSDNHSEKPEEFRRIIDELYPRGRRIELFARRKSDGWDIWGNEDA